MIPTARTLLFVPASRPDFIAKAPGRGADVVILDLEDGVAPADKPLARATLAAHLQQLADAGQRTWVRIDATAQQADLAALAGRPLEAVMRPKTHQASDAASLAAQLPAGVALVPLIESCQGLINAAAIARAHPRVAALALGSEDLAAELGVTPGPRTLAQPAQWLVIAARAAGLPAYGLPGSLAEFRDLGSLAALARRAAQLGLEGALAVHPAQVATLRQAFVPSADQQAWAHRVLQAAATAVHGAFQVDGRMVDRPVLDRARRLLAPQGLTR